MWHCVLRAFLTKYSNEERSSLDLVWSRELSRNVLNGRITTAFQTALRNVSFEYESYNDILIGILILLLWLIINNSSSKRPGCILYNNIITRQLQETVSLWPHWHVYTFWQTHNNDAQNAFCRRLRTHNIIPITCSFGPKIYFPETYIGAHNGADRVIPTDRYFILSCIHEWIGEKWK